MAGAGAEPGQQVETCRDLAKAGEVMLDEKGAVIAKPLGLDIVLDEFAKPLTAVGIGAGASRLRAAEEPKSHSYSPKTARSTRRNPVAPAKAGAQDG
jgi:hypothetical protein